MWTKSRPQLCPSHVPSRAGSEGTYKNGPCFRNVAPVERKHYSRRILRAAIAPAIQARFGRLNQIKHPIVEAKKGRWREAADGF
jgi:hypothetical protein